VGFPVTDAALDRLMEKTAFHRRFASAVARKAGLRQGTAEVPPRTIIDAFFSPDEPPYARQYVTDLSGLGRLRIYSRSSVPVYLFRSEDLTEELRPQDYAPMLDANSDPVFADSSGSTLNWQTLAPADAVPLRLTLSMSLFEVGWDPDALDGPFSVSVQVAS
jgi:hypothetical protein